MKQLGEFAPDERAEWRADPRTQAALAVIRESVLSSLTDVISYGRNGNVTETHLRLAVGRHDMAERILRALTEER
jgi:hypothetical protein